MSAEKTFVDTNILVYAYDVSAGPKRLIARKILADLWRSGLGVISTQVLQEFYVTVTKKLPKPMDSESARQIVVDLLKWETVAIDGELILQAIDLHKERGYSFWDSLIVLAAMDAGCKTLLSEDLSSGETIKGVVIENPLHSQNV